MLQDLIEQVAFEARSSEYVDQKSGVSARLTISAYEQLVATAERRALRNGEMAAAGRISDLFSIMPAITGKVELVYEGEQEGPALVARNLVKKAIRSLFPLLFPDPERLKKKSGEQAYQQIIQWFGEGNSLDMLNDAPQGEYASQLALVPGLEELVNRFQPAMASSHGLLLQEFVLHALAEYSLLSKQQLERQTTFKDLLSSMFRFDEDQP